MKLLKPLLLGITVFIYCYVNAQTNSETDKDSLYITCFQCDSLYNQICPDSVVFFINQEHPAQFPGDVKDLMLFLRNHIQYPTECKEKAIQGRVVVKFIIDETGKIICPYIRGPLHPLLDEEALRLIKLMPDWVPASSGGVPYKTCYTIPIRFKL